MALEAQESINTTYQIPHHIPADIFRSYDIRGPVEDNALTPHLSYAIGLAIGSEAIKEGESSIVIGYDGRLSSPEITQALICGLYQTGISIINTGMVTTPLVYFATNRTDTRSGVMVTGSHNPSNHNGFKIVLKGKTLNTNAIQNIRYRIENHDFIHNRKGNISNKNLIPEYQQYIIEHIQIKQPLKIVIDCGNGIAGKIAPNLYRALGCEVTPLFCEVDGRFPNHHPDPTIPDNLSTLINTVLTTKSDIGLAFDGDGDRLGLVTDQGEIIWPDRQMMLFAIDILTRQPKSDIIFDVKCSRHLKEIIQQHGGNPIMWKTGHSIIKEKLAKTQAPLAGEMSGHIFFKDQWFGFDDGLYVGARLLQILAASPQSISDIFSKLPNSINTPELKVSISDTKKQAFMQKFLNEAHFNNAKIITIDGARVEFQNGWGLIRASNTSPSLTLRFEADTTQDLRTIQSIFRSEMLKINQHLKICF